MSDKKERYFGLHFDFHATPELCKDVRLGESLKEEDIANICEALRPDFLQIDCKGHPGYASYPTKIGTPAAEFAKDPLKVWREVTAKHGVRLYVHYSGVWDSRYLSEHPEDGKKSPDFEGIPRWLARSSNYTSVFGPYAERLMIPQLKEVADYGVDGAWVDGDCWACVLDVSPCALDAFFQETGIRLQAEDVTPEHEQYVAYRAFCREGFRKYVDRYAKALHDHRPDFGVCSNWAYSEQMPEKVTTDVDFLSGDFSPADSFHGALFSGRILASQGKPWDLMSWGFRRIEAGKPSTRCIKHPVQLMQEAATILSLGGGFQVYFIQNNDASAPMPRLLGMKALADFCHARRAFCFGAKTLPEVVLFNSTYDHYENIPAGMLFGNHGLYDTHHGWAKLLADGGHSFEIREEHNLFPCIDDYKMVVCPEIITRYEAQTKEKLLSYAENGGVLVLAGIKLLNLFGIACDPIEYTEEEGKTRVCSPVLSLDGARYDSIYGKVCAIRTEGETLAVAHREYESRRFETTYDIAKRIPYGKGMILAIGVDLGLWYNSLKTVSCRDLSELLLAYYTPTARVRGSHKVVLNVTKKDGKLQLHLVNASGDHADRTVDSFDEIPPLYHLTLEVHLDKAPRALTLQPSGEALPFVYENGILRTQIPKVEIYEIAEISF